MIVLFGYGKDYQRLKALRRDADNGYVSVPEYLVDTIRMMPWPPTDPAIPFEEAK